MCFLSPTIVFLVITLQVGQETSPFSLISRCHWSSGFAGEGEERGVTSNLPGLLDLISRKAVKWESSWCYKKRDTLSQAKPKLDTNHAAVPALLSCSCPSKLGHWVISCGVTRPADLGKGGSPFQLPWYPAHWELKRDDASSHLILPCLE